MFLGRRPTDGHLWLVQTIDEILAELSLNIAARSHQYFEIAEQEDTLVLEPLILRAVYTENVLADIYELEDSSGTLVATRKTPV